MNYENTNETGNRPRTERIEDALLLLVLIDASASMKACRDEVIRFHPIMLDALRSSAPARKGCLYVSQYLFNSSRNALNPFTLLSPVPGGDRVPILDASNYVCDGKTACYQILHTSMQDLLTMFSHLQETESLSAEFSTVVVTDGVDTESRVDPADIRNLLQELRDKRMLNRSVIVDPTKSALTSDRLESMMKSLGFDSVISAMIAPREIRRAFFDRELP